MLAGLERAGMINKGKEVCGNDRDCGGGDEGQGLADEGVMVVVGVGVGVGVVVVVLFMVENGTCRL